MSRGSFISVGYSFSWKWDHGPIILNFSRRDDAEMVWNNRADESMQNTLGSKVPGPKADDPKVFGSILLKDIGPGGESIPFTVRRK